MRFENVCLESIGCQIPDEIITTAELEKRLKPLYERLRLPEGRLELMTGIRQRRVWQAGTLPSTPSTLSVQAALDAAGFAARDVGCLIHASVCRDFLEPATAARVHHQCQLPRDCWVYDVSNACLGLLNGAVQIATLIESGVIRAGVVVGTENSRPLMEQTILHLNENTSLTRRSIKPAIASLTIGSGSCAWLLVHRELSSVGSPIAAAVAEANTAFHNLCRSDSDSAGASMQPLMDTDSEQLLEHGVATGAAAFKRFVQATGWQPGTIDRSICHQVGGKHRELMLAAMGLDVERDYATFPWLGNTGSVALPLTLAAAAHYGHLSPQSRVGLFGIGSGINSVMLAADWQLTPVAGNLPSAEPYPILKPADSPA